MSPWPALRKSVGLLLVTASIVGQEATWSEAQRASADGWARQVELDLRAGELTRLQGRFDREVMADAILADLKVDGGNRRAMRQGLVEGLANSTTMVLEEWSASEPKFKRVLVLDGRLHARFRFRGESGIAIIDLVLQELDDGWTVVDFHNRLMGMGLVEQTRQTAALLLAGEDAGLLARLFGAGSVSLDDADRIKRMVTAWRGGDPTAALAAFDELSQPVRDSAAVTTIRIQCLAMTDDADAYATALERACERHPAPLFRFAMVDAHFVRGRWDAAIACIDECQKAIEPDAVLLTLRAGMQHGAGRAEDAQQTLAEALRLEPDCVYALSSGLDVWLATKNWRAVRDAIVALEKTGAYDFHGVLGEEAWAGFREAPESEPWR